MRTPSLPQMYLISLNTATLSSQHGTKYSPGNINFFSCESRQVFGKNPHRLPWVCDELKYSSRFVYFHIQVELPSDVNRPLPSSENPHFRNEAKCTTFLVKMSFICTRMKSHFHIKG